MPKPTTRRAMQRGQAMVEYSLINWLLIVALVLSTSVKLIPGPAGPMSIIEMFLDAYQAYYDSFYFVLNLPFP